MLHHLALELKITTWPPPPPFLFSLDTCSIDTDHYANFRILRKKESVGFAFYWFRSDLISSVVWELTTKGEKLFHCGIVHGRKNLHWITVCLVSTILGTVWWPGRFQNVSRVRYLSFSIDTAPQCILWKRRRENRSLQASRDGTHAHRASHWHYLCFTISGMSSGLLSSELSLPD